MTHIQSLAVHEKKYTAPAIALDWRHHIRIRRAARLVAPHPSRASSAEHGGPLAAPRRLFHACPALFIDARASFVRLSDELLRRIARNLSYSYSLAAAGLNQRSRCSTLKNGA